MRSLGAQPTRNRRPDPDDAVELGSVKMPSDGRSVIPFHTFLWKISSRCNIDCTYCYVYNSVDQEWRKQPKLMSEEIARQCAIRMREHLTVHKKSSANLIFHGGEPLIGGIGHLRMLVKVIDEVFANSGIELSLGMQTNLLLFTDEIGEFFVSRKISMGVSLDGPPEVNDRYRVDRKGRPTSGRLEAKLALLTSAKYRSIFGGLLCVVDPLTDPIEVTEYLLSYDPPGMDFLLPLNNHERLPPGKKAVGSGAPYGDWLVSSYDYWLSRPNTTKVRTFQSIINLICGTNSLVEALGLHPVDLIVVETNGEIEAVDSLKTTFPRATKTGFNVTDDAFDVVAQNAQVRSRQLGATALCTECQNCPIVNVCGGGYIPHRFSKERGFENPSIYCDDLKRIIYHIYKSVHEAVSPMMKETFMEGATER
jgi:uncharacterized protein